MYIIYKQTYIGIAHSEIFYCWVHHQKSLETTDLHGKKQVPSTESMPLV